MKVPMELWEKIQAYKPHVPDIIPPNSTIWYLTWSEVKGYKLTHSRMFTSAAEAEYWATNNRIDNYEIHSEES